MVKVTIYSRPGCHLCDIARERVENVRGEVAFEVEEVDVTSDPALCERHGERIPVVAVEGEEVCVYRVSEKLLKRRVLEAHDRKGRCDMEGGSQAQEQPRTGVVARIVGTFVSPGETFASVRASSSRAEWVIPWVIAAVIATALAQWITPISVRAGLEKQRERIEQNSDLTKEQKEAQIESIEKAMSKGAAVARISTMLVVPLTSLAVLAILSLIYLGIANFLFGGTGTYLKVMTAAAYGELIGALKGLVVTPLAVAKNSIHVSMGPALLFPPDMEHTWAYRLAAGVDIFTIWYLVVASIGVGVVSGIAPKKVGAVLFPLWLVLVVGGGAFVRNMFGT